MISSGWPTAEQPQQVPFIVQQVAYLREEGVEVEVFPFWGKASIFNYLKAWKALRATHRLETYDLIHAQFGQSGLLAWKAEVPLVVTFRGSDLEGIVGNSGGYTAGGYLLTKISRMVARRAAAVILVSEHLSRYLYDDVQHHIIPSGIDFDLFQPMSRQEARRQAGLPLHKRLVLFAASPDNPVKRYDLARKAIDSIRGDFDLELLVLAGVPREQVRVYMNACDVLLITSKHEGSPNVVKEALACNVPVVSVDVGDVRQRIEAVEGCILCGDDSWQTIGKAVAEVLRRQPVIKGREAVLDLDERLLARKVKDVYQTVLDRRAQRSNGAKRV
jgi:glycosyltransferase involved in cell wall biosynthesis